MKKVYIIAAILVISTLFFRNYIFGGKLLFPSNLLVAFYSPWNTEQYPGWTNIPFKGLGSDNLFIFYPMKLVLRQAIHERSLPLWTPYNFAGGPVFGDGQSAPMYPLTYLYLLPSLPDAFSIMVILVPTLTMIFTYGMLRHFKLGKISSLFGAVTFAFSGFMSVWMEENPAVSQSAIWLPLLVWTADLLITQPRMRWFVAFAVSTAVMMSSGFLQICLYQLAFIGAYTLWKNIRRVWLVMLSGISGLLLVAPYLFMTWESYKLSPRDFVAVPEIRSIFLVQWTHILSLFNPDWLGNPGTFNYFGIGSYYDKALFIGVIPLVFVLIGLFRQKSGIEKFLWGVTFVTLVMGFSSPFTQWLFSLPIPILSSMLPSRIFYLTTFALAVIAAIRFDKSEKPNFRPLIGIYTGVLILLELFLIAYYIDLSFATTIRSFFVQSMKLTQEYPKILMRNIAVSIALTGITFFVLKFNRYTKISLLLLTILSAWYFTNKSIYYGERQFVFPLNPVLQELQRIAGRDRVGFVNRVSRIPAGGNVMYGWYSPEGINPVFALRLGQLLRSAENGGILTNDIPRITAELDLERASVEASTSPRIQKLMWLLDMKYIVERKESGWYARVFPNHKNIWESTYMRIWENPDVLPRAFIVSDLIIEKDPQKILDSLYDPNTDLIKTAIIEEQIENSSSTTNTKELVTFSSYRMNDVTLSVHASKSGLLVLTDTFAPGWHAKVDGIETPVYRTNFTFRGVPVPAGDHEVFMYYWPDSLVYGLWAMGGGILILIAIMFVRKFPERV